jgi:hypothetical protein
MIGTLGLKRVAAVAVALLCATGCGTDDPNAEFADALTVVGGKKVAGEQLPAESGSGPSVSSLFGPALNAVPGQSFTLQIPYSGGAVDKVFVDLGGDSYWELAVNAAASSGQIPVLVQVSSSFDIEEAFGIQASYSVHGVNGSVSMGGSTLVNACTKGGTCTPGQKDSGSGSGTPVCQESGVACSNGKTYRACVDSKGTSCWYEFNGQRYNCAANCECSGAAQQVASVCSP